MKYGAQWLFMTIDYLRTTILQQLNILFYTEISFYTMKFYQLCFLLENIRNHLWYSMVFVQQNEIKICVISHSLVVLRLARLTHIQNTRTTPTSGRSSVPSMSSTRAARPLCPHRGPSLHQWSPLSTPMSWSMYWMSVCSLYWDRFPDFMTIFYEPLMIVYRGIKLSWKHCWEGNV